MSDRQKKLDALAARLARNEPGRIEVSTDEELNAALHHFTRSGHPMFVATSVARPKMTSAAQFMNQAIAASRQNYVEDHRSGFTATDARIRQLNEDIASKLQHIAGKQRQGSNPHVAAEIRMIEGQIAGLQAKVKALASTASDA